ncbi:MAG: hypothetical protein P0Y53_24165 [Candidatus Pseudobacter hemicellulosilyticus]|uniref:TonB-dependent receptor n=1 Tax=Candidatus Pseudobacter hemicellulosilyticus TaxID=3121375 RepID=A0AAJ5WRY4_9BACT|nr:MAG: hypothetical protein P0Y53_24165 [Pseudobacter sp.]
MRHLKPILIIACFLCPLWMSAQTDSTYFDAGGVLLRKEYTHHVTVKGEDLAKMPFRSLREAVNVYFSGRYTDQATLVYVVDGIPMNDADAYPIQDIESVSMVLDAQANLRTSSGSTAGNDVLILVTTRQHSGRPKGISFAGSSYLVDRHFMDGEGGGKSASSPDFFHQYYLSARFQQKKLTAGVSANILRDILPTAEFANAAKQSSTPYQLTRFRFNGWLSYQLHPRHELTARMYYMPQQAKGKDELELNFTPGQTTQFRSSQDGNQNILKASVQLRSRLWKHWENLLSVAYLNGESGLDMNQLTYVPTAAYPNNGSMLIATDRMRTEHFSIRDHIRYTLSAGQFSFQPSLDMQYHYFFYKDNYATMYGSGLVIGAEPGLGNPGSISTAGTQAKGEYYSFTPALSVEYKNVALLTAGLRKFLPTGISSQGYTPDALPFVSGTVKLGQLIQHDGQLPLSLYGSYAKLPYGTNVLGTAAADPANGYMYSVHLPGITATPGSWPTIGQDKDRSWQAGANASLLNKKLTLDYNYQDMASYITLLLGTPGPGGIFNQVSDWKLKAASHRIGIGTDLALGQLNWRAGIQATTQKQEISAVRSDSSVAPIGPATDPKNKWTGGWNNHFSIGKFNAGFNVLYYFDRQLVSNGSIVYFQEANSFMLQHIYAGINLGNTRIGNLDLYLSGRNIFRTRDGDADNTYLRYYGLGANLKL